MAITDQLTERLGPLPVWTWGALAGGTIALGSWLVRRNRTPQPEPGTTTTPTGPATGLPAPAPQPTTSEPGTFFAGPSIGYVPPAAYAPPIATTEPAASSNDDWQRLAAAAILARSPQISAITVTDALDAYVSGRPVTVAAAAIIETAIRLQGLPPYPVPPIRMVPEAPAPVTAPPPAPAPAPAPPPPAPPVDTRWIGAPLTPIQPEWWPSLSPSQQAEVTARIGYVGTGYQSPQWWIDNPQQANTAFDLLQGPRRTPPAYIPPPPGQFGP